MPTYRYTALDREGRRTNGEIDAADREQALARLTAAGWRSIEFADVPPGADEPIADEPIVAEVVGRATLSTAESVQLGELLGMLAGAGAPLDAGLKAAALEMRPGRLSRALAAISQSLAGGAPLNEALASQGWRFPLYLRGLVLAGLHSGRLGVVLEEFVGLERRAALLRRQVALSLAYPTLLLSLLLGLAVFYSLAVVPPITAIFNDFEVDLPAQTLALIELSEGGIFIPAGGLLMLVAFWLLVWLSTDVAEIRSILKAAPLVGPIARWSSLARFSRLLALLVENRLELAESLRLAGAGSRDFELLVACRQAALRVEGGCALGEAIDQSPAFAKSLVPIVDWGQRAGALPDALRTAGEMFESRVQAQLVYVRMITPPLTFLLIVWGVLFLVSALMLPMVSLIEKLN